MTMSLYDNPRPESSNTFDYLDELQRRLDETMDRPMPEYQPEQTPVQKLRASDWDAIKGTFNDWLQWRLSAIPGRPQITDDGRVVQSPEDEQKMMDLITGFAAPMKLSRGGNMMAVPNKGTAPWWNKSTPATAEKVGEEWAAENPGISKDQFYWGMKNLKNAVADMFEPQKLGEYAPKGPRSMPWNEVASKAGIDPAFPEAMPRASTPGVSRASAGPEVLADRTVMTPWEDVSKRIGLDEGEINRLAGGSGAKLGTDSGASARSLRDPVNSLLEKLLGPTAYDTLAEAMNSIKKPFWWPNRTEGGKALDAIVGALGIGWYGSNHPHGWLFGAESGPRQASAQPLRPAVTPQGIEQERMRQEGMFVPDQYSDEMRRKRFGY